MKLMLSLSTNFNSVNNMQTFGAVDKGVVRDMTEEELEVASNKEEKVDSL